MCAAPQPERREHPRFPLAMGVQFYHGPSQREFPGRTVDVARGGTLMYVPATTPVRVGQTIRVDVGGIPPQFADLGQGPVEATIVRVDRGKFASKGQVAIGVRFAGA